MKTFRILICMFIAGLFTMITFAEVKVPSQEKSVFSVSKSGMTRMVSYHNQMIPVIDLPEINITGVKPGSVLVAVKMIDGKYMLQANLPEVEISGNSNGMLKLRTIVIDGETMLVAELPTIEISASFPYQQLSLVNNGNQMPVVELPEVVISSSLITDKTMLAVIKNGAVMPVINLPVVEISDYKYSWNFSTTTDYDFENKDIKWIYISLRNCGITVENKIICEIASLTPVLTPSEISNTRNFN